MTPAARPFPFHHGSLSLSFSGTLGDRGSDPVERLDSTDALADWLAQAGLAPRDATVTPRGFARALRLREAIGRAAASLAADGLPEPADVAIINDAAKHAPARIALDARTLRTVEVARDAVQAALGRIARDAIELFGDPAQRERLRACRLPACGSIFLTPAGRRERHWCSMERCGNRAKVGAYRERARDRG